MLLLLFRYFLLQEYSQQHGMTSLETLAKCDDDLTVFYYLFTFLLQEYCQQQGMTLVEMFAKFDADGSMSVTHAEFREGLKVSFRLHD